ncbi:hypothetical protein OIU77_001661 [Salix suchowensis]|uniref:Solute carrier family 25 member 44 n=1 Tax=Salix suchowensis TaxID=1278906 RepID=A0ABQ9B298_9ROSI|nr:solute carrier family member [Salix suchowensis]KAJ6371200.1 hypothetical protein OIU77_001661 [Salix suchowensis]
MAASSLGQTTEINWDKLDKTKFYVVGAGIFTGVTVGLYPMSVIKTRLQVATKDTVEKSASSVIRGILKTDGVPGLYRGFGTVITGAIPTRIIFLTALETTKAAAFKMLEPFKFSEPSQAALANGIAGMSASLCSQAIFVPIDVISQKLMVQGYSGHEKYNGGLDVARKIIRTDGIRGFYRGFGLSVMTYSPSSAVWWASYGSSQRIIWRLLGQGTDREGAAPSESTIMLVQATGGIISGATASCITTPLDTIKTRLQVFYLLEVKHCLVSVFSFCSFCIMFYGYTQPVNQCLFNLLRRIIKASQWVLASNTRPNIKTWSFSFQLDGFAVACNFMFNIFSMAL